MGIDICGFDIDRTGCRKSQPHNTPNTRRQQPRQNAQFEIPVRESMGCQQTQPKIGTPIRTARLYSVPKGDIVFNCGIPYDVMPEVNSTVQMSFDEGDSLVIIDVGNESDVFAKAFHSTHGMVQIDRHAIVHTKTTVG